MIFYKPIHCLSKYTEMLFSIAARRQAAYGIKLTAEELLNVFAQEVVFNRDFGERKGIDFVL